MSEIAAPASSKSGKKRARRAGQPELGEEKREGERKKMYEKKKKFLPSALARSAARFPRLFFSLPLMHTRWRLCIYIIMCVLYDRDHGRSIVSSVSERVLDPLQRNASARVSSLSDLDETVHKLFISTDDNRANGKKRKRQMKGEGRVHQLVD